MEECMEKALRVREGDLDSSRPRFESRMVNGCVVMKKVRQQPAGGKAGKSAQLKPGQELYITQLHSIIFELVVRLPSTRRLLKKHVLESHDLRNLLEEIRAAE
jgi:hypothetical protein